MQGLFFTFFQQKHSPTLENSYPEYYISNMNNFINREKELSQLLNLHQQKKDGALAIVYGRRRLGKTRLIKEFCQGTYHCYFMADRAGEEALKRSLAISLAAALDEPLLETLSFQSWYDLFSAIDRFRSKERRLILILDEYQYLCQVQPAFSSFMQKWWDEHWQQSNITLVLCGSVTSMMYKETMAASAPLYGRADLQLLLAPMHYSHTRSFLTSHDEQSLVEMYSLSGGVPRYLELLQPFQSFSHALRDLILNKNGILYQEARYLLHEEITTPNTCWSLLNELGRGTGRISELASRLQLPANQLTRYIELLRDLFLIYREVPVLEKNPQKSKKGFYQVADPFMRLWFGSIYPYESFLEFDQAELVELRLQPLLQNHISHCFETMCRDFVRQRVLELGCLRVGRQWGKGYEIDIAGVDEQNELAVVGECKWSKHQVGLSVLSELKEKIEKNKLPMSPTCTFFLFSKSGFSPDLQDKAREDDKLQLVSSLFG